MRFTRVNSGQFSAVHYTNKLLNANCPFGVGVGVLRLYFGKSKRGLLDWTDRILFPTRTAVHFKMAYFGWG